MGLNGVYTVWYTVRMFTVTVGCLQTAVTVT